MRVGKRWIIAPCVLLLAAGLAQWPVRGGAVAPGYRTAVVERGDLVVAVNVAGTLNAVMLVEVGSQISGQIKEVLADFNSPVVRGQLIARIDPDIFQAKVAAAQADLEHAEASVSVARASIAKESATMESARRELDRKSELLRKQLIAQRETDDARTALDTAGAQVASARAQLVAMEAGARHKRAVLRQARIDLRSTEIRAPVDGVVISRNVNVGQTVAASLQAPTLFTIAQDLKQMQVEATVVEADVTGFAAGQDVTFTVDAQPGRTFTGKVAQVRKAPQTKDNIVTYVVVVSVVGPADGLLPGMTANLQVVAGRRNGILKVPNAALRFRPDQTAESTRGTTAEGVNQIGVAGRVFVVAPNGQPTPVAVRLGRTDGRMTELLRGDLTEGQTVITGSTLPASTERRLFTFRLL
jgi:HlyD family secretion protein